MLLSRSVGSKERGVKELLSNRDFNDPNAEHHEWRITADTRHMEHRAYKQGRKLDNEGHTPGTNELMMRTKQEQETD